MNQALELLKLKKNFIIARGNYRKNLQIAKNNPELLLQLDQDFLQVIAHAESHGLKTREVPFYRNC